METRVLALDLSITCTGWASQLASGATISGAQAFKAPRGAQPAIRFRQFNDWLLEMFEMLEPEIVVIEEAVCRHHGGTQDALIGVRTRVLELCAVHGTPWHDLHPTSIKKLTTGDGAAEKEDMQEWAATRCGHYNPANDAGADEADALGLLWVWLSCQRELAELAEQRTARRQVKRAKDAAEREAGRTTQQQRRTARKEKRRAAKEAVAA